MLIKIKDPDAFRCATNVALGAQNYQGVYRYVRLSPQGAVTGTDGFMLAHNPRGCEPFEGEGDVLVRPQKAIPAGAWNIKVDTDAGLVTYVTGPKNTPGVIPCGVTTEGAFPDVERVIPSHYKPTDGTPLAVNWKLLTRLTKGLNLSGRDNFQVRLERSGSQTPVLIYVPDNPDLTLALMPLRTEDAEPRLKPWPVSERAA
jgi:hypothetical protein